MEVMLFLIEIVVGNQELRVYWGDLLPADSKKLFLKTPEKTLSTAWEEALL